MSNYPDALNTEALEMALTLLNGNRRDVREFVLGHDTPAKLVLAIARHLGSETVEQFNGCGSFLDAVVNLQALLETVEV